MSQYEEQPQTDTTPQDNRPQSAGATLARQREAAGMSLDEVANQLNLAKRQVEALEQDRFDALPGNTFVRGFVRNYARLLQIDPQPLLNDLAARLPEEVAQAALPRLQDEAMPIMRHGSAIRPGPMMLAVLVGLLVALAVGGAWFYLNNHHEPQLTVDTNPPPNAAVAQPALVTSEPAPVQVNPAPVETNANAVQPAPQADTVAPVTTPVPSPAPQATAGTPTVLPAATPAATSPAAIPAAAVPTTPVSPVGADRTAEVRVVARGDSWVQVTDADGKRLISELIKAGDSRSVSGKPPYQVRIGNGRNTELYYKGQQTDLTTHLKVDVATLELK